MALMVSTGPKRMWGIFRRQIGTWRNNSSRVGRPRRDERHRANDRSGLPLIEPDMRISRIRLSGAIDKSLGGRMRYSIYFDADM